MKKYLIYLILCVSLFLVSCDRTENNGTKDAVSDNELSRVDEEETVKPENKENNIEGPKPINPKIEIKGDIN